MACHVLTIFGGLRKKNWVLELAIPDLQFHRIMPPSYIQFLCLDYSPFEQEPCLLGFMLFP